MTCFKCLCYFSAEKRFSRTPRRTQQPKTLNTPEDSTYYTLIHRSLQDDKRKPRKQDPGKLLDVDDQYYHTLSTSKSVRSMTTENTTLGGIPERRQSVERRQSMERRKSMDRRRSTVRSHHGDRQLSTVQRSAGSSRQMRERAVTEPELPRPTKQDNRRSIPRMSSTESRSGDNPYDFRHLLRKTSQRRKLIKQY
ncbi:hypothetical protein CHARACLAT_013696 [Characodon lateralis]|uniref:Uncharacterized protein n=1 Tax=Characodon lateralis TaxID=208331 RepID=A0ABU7EM18_9TELE|nr:hypothetical protein [Characodon lateralis]